MEALVSKKCRRFVLAHWGKDGLRQIQERPVSWALYNANPRLKRLRRRRKDTPLITVRSTPNRIHLMLSTEQRAPRHG